MITNFNIFLNEKFLFNLEEDIGVYLNPITTKKFNNKSRGFATIDGDLYLIDDCYGYVHGDSFRILRRKEYLMYPGIYNLWDNINLTLKYIVPIQKSNKFDIFYLSESINYTEIENNYDNIVNIFKNVKKKNPQYKFVVYPADGSPDDDYFKDYNKFYLEI